MKPSARAAFALALASAGVARAQAEPPATVPLAACARLYDEVVHDDVVDYAAVAAHPDRDACRRALAEAPAPTARTPAAAAIAFWSDAYNLLTLLAIAEDPQRWSVRQDGRALFRDRVFTVAGLRLTLDQIEHEQLAAHAKDPRVEFLLSCGARSCSLLPRGLLSTRAAPGSDAALAAAMAEGMRRWFARPDNLRVRRQHDGGVVEVGQLLQTDWHGGDFERAGTPLVALVARALEDRGGADDRAAAADLRRGALKLAIRPYDWRLNRARRVFWLP